MNKFEAQFLRHLLKKRQNKYPVAAYDYTVRNIIMARFYLCENPRVKRKEIRHFTFTLQSWSGTAFSYLLFRLSTIHQLIVYLPLFIGRLFTIPL